MFVYMTTKAASEPDGPKMKTYTLCSNCWKPIFETRRGPDDNRGSGRWYHRATASVSCHPGVSSRRVALPSGKTIQLPAPGQRAS